MYTFHSALRFARESRGLSKAELARRADVSPTSIANYERDLVPESYRTVSALERAMNLPHGVLTLHIRDADPLNLLQLLLETDSLCAETETLIRLAETLLLRTCLPPESAVGR